MDEHLLALLKKIRIETMNKNLKKFTFSEIEKKTGISRQELLEIVKDEEELIARILELERQKFEEIFTTHDFEGVNAIDILLTVSKEVARNFVLVSPALTIHLKEEFPEIYQDHFDKRLEFIFGKIQINLTKGINQGMYREDLSIELLARLYLSRLIDIHNPQLFPPEKFSFETLFAVMFESFVRSIAKPEGIAYFEKKIKSVKFEISRD
jgi:TetR/AcrR family transcriptional regulator, cholesterol catabolism regulator